jgi:hypothetical protein
MDVAIAGSRDKVVLVLGRHQKLDGLYIILQIHRDLYGSQSVEKSHELLGFVLNKCLGTIANVPMPGRDFDLHRINSCCGGNVPRDWLNCSRDANLLQYGRIPS